LAGDQAVLVGAEVVVEGAVEIELRQCQDLLTILDGEPRGQDRINRPAGSGDAYQGVGHGIRRPEVGCGDAVAAEQGVEAAVAVVAHQGERLVAAVADCAGHDEGVVGGSVAVAEAHDGVALGGEAKVGQHRAAAVELRIEVADVEQHARLEFFHGHQPGRSAQHWRKEAERRKSCHVEPQVSRARMHCGEGIPRTLVSRWRRCLRAWRCPATSGPERRQGGSSDNGDTFDGRPDEPVDFDGVHERAYH